MRAIPTEKGESSNLNVKFTICCHIENASQIWLLYGSCWCSFIQRWFQSSSENIYIQFMNNGFCDKVDMVVHMSISQPNYLGQTTRIFSLSAMQIKSKCSRSVKPCGTWSDKNSGGCGMTRKIRPAALYFNIRLLQ